MAERSFCNCPAQRRWNGWSETRSFSGGDEGYGLQVERLRATPNDAY